MGSKINLNINHMFTKVIFNVLDIIYGIYFEDSYNKEILFESSRCNNSGQTILAYLLK